MEEIESESYHVSLTKTVYLKFHQIETILKKVKQENFKKIKLALTNSVKYFSNEYNSRHFLVLEIMKNKNLLWLTAAVEKILIENGFENPTYNVSKEN